MRAPMYVTYAWGFGPECSGIFTSRFAAEHRRGVSSLTEASDLYCRVRDTLDRVSAHGYAKMPDGFIWQDGHVIARISYNGKVWPNQDWKPGQVPLLNPYEGRA